MDKKTTEFRISGDPSVSITAEEVEAQRKAAMKIQQDKERLGQLVEPDHNDLSRGAQTHVDRMRHAARRAHDVRAGMGDGSIRMPSEESIQGAIDAGDIETAHLYQLQQVQPGTPEFMAKAPPAEEVIEVFGPKGAEGFGVVKKYVGIGPEAGIKEL